ncbi:MAG TPA: MtrB/PioB family outer membrane beta-barrel protein, partial [Alphaproteobacteria bacterium]|nr:MtrB/PioB family outer membrane beta-barrel protein [Alphaproteobacteria bacterium]
MSGKILKSLLMASVCVVPFAADAADDPDPSAAQAPGGTSSQKPVVYGNGIEAGIMGQTGSSARFGKYTGMTGSGPYGIGNLQYSYRGASPDDPLNTFAYDVTGSNLGLDSRSWDMRVRDQGKWDLRFTYDGIPYNDTDHFQSAYNKDGSLRNGITAGSLVAPAISANTFAGSAGFFKNAGSTTTTAYFDSRGETLTRQLTSQDIGTQRDTFSLVGKYDIGWGWSFNGNLKHDHKEGTKQSSFLVGSNTSIPSSVSLATGASAPAGGGTASLAFFPQPID